MAENDRCNLCNDELHSITTRRVGNAKLCIRCGDKVLPLMNETLDEMVENMKRHMNEGMTLDYLIMSYSKMLAPERQARIIV